jgi:hypothetical protein
MTLAQIEQEALKLPGDDLRKLIARLIAANVQRDEAGWREINRRLDDKNPDSWVSLDAAKLELLRPDGV